MHEQQTMLGSFVVREMISIGAFVPVSAASAIHTLQKGQFAKGQLISKGLFIFFNSLKKQMKHFCPGRLGQKLTFSSSLFGRIEDTKIFF